MSNGATKATTEAEGQAKATSTGDPENGPERKGGDLIERSLGRAGTRAYQSSLEAALAIPIAMGLGYWADSSFETEPVFLMVGLALGFVTFVLRLVQMRKLVEASAAQAPEATASGNSNEEIQRVLERIRSRNSDVIDGASSNTEEQRAQEDGGPGEDWDEINVWSTGSGDDEERER